MLNTVLRKIFVLNAGYSYSNLSRLFMRLFAGVMILQMALRQMTRFDAVCAAISSLMPSVAEQAPTLVSMMIVMLIVCSTLWMLGLLFRFSLIFPLAVMVMLEVLLHSGSVDAAHVLMELQPGNAVMMMIGIFMYMLLSGPGKISLDYIISVHMVSLELDKPGEEERELNEA